MKNWKELTAWLLLFRRKAYFGEIVCNMQLWITSFDVCIVSDLVRVAVRSQADVVLDLAVLKDHHL